MQNSSAHRFHTLNFAAPQRILVATDLTDCDYLVPYVVAQAKASNARVTLVHAIAPANSFPAEAGAIVYRDRDGIDRDVRAVLLKMAGQIEAHGIVCNVDLRHGFASDVVREALPIPGLRGSSLAPMAGESSGNSPWVGSQRTAQNRGNPNLCGWPWRSQLRRSCDAPEDPASRLAGWRLPEERRLCRRPRAELWRRTNAAACHDPRIRKQGFGALAYLGPERARSTCSGGSEACPAGAIYHRIREGHRGDTERRHPHGADWIVLGVDSDFPAWSFKDSMAYKVLAAASCPVCTIRHEPRVAEAVTLKSATKQDVNHIVEVLA